MAPGFRLVSVGRALALALASLSALSVSQGCGSRTELVPADTEETGKANPHEVKPPKGPCTDGDTAPCGIDEGACELGLATCFESKWGPCVGNIEPEPEACNGIDDDCDGTIDNGFHLDEACDGPDTDLCLDDVITCEGCSLGPSELETCNGRDDDCDGIVDSDCESGDCQPTLVVTGSTPSSPSCVDFPVQASSTGMIQYPCGGGFVTAQLGEVGFSGSVQNDHVSLTGTVIIGADRSPDGCVWRTDHAIEGNLSTGQLSYSYSENFVQGVNCWSPCTEIGTIQVQWVQRK